MKRQYIRRAARAMALPRAQRREVLRDLDEIFASAREHGETEAQVIERLGPAEAYASAVSAQLGAESVPAGRRRIALFACPTAALVGLGAWALWLRAPSNIIGQANCATTIRAFAPGSVIVAAAFAACIALLSVVGAVWVRKGQKRENEGEKP